MSKASFLIFSFIHETLCCVFMAPQLSHIFNEPILAINLTYKEITV